MSLTTEVMAIFVIFWLILAKYWLPWQRPLDPCNQKCLLRIGRPRKPPVISNHILPISHRNAFICIYSNFSPKILAMVTPLCPLCRGVSEMNSAIAQTLSQNQTLHWCIAYNWSYGNFCDIFAYFGQNLVAIATSLRPLQSEMSYLDWSTPKTIHRTKNFVTSCYTSEVMSIRRFATSLALQE